MTTSNGVPWWNCNCFCKIKKYCRSQFLCNGVAARTGPLAGLSLSSVMLVDKVRLQAGNTAFQFSFPQWKQGGEELNHWYYSMKYWRYWWHLFRSVVPNAVFSMIVINNLTSVDVTKLFIFVKECPLRYNKYSHKKICYAQKAHMHCILCS